MKFSKVDLAVSAVVVLLSGALVFLYSSDVYGVRARKDGVRIGSVEFRKNVSTKRAADDPRWERIGDASAVYDGDTIRTGGLAETRIRLTDGTVITVYENSMVRLDLTKESQSFELSGGTVHVEGGDESSATKRVIKTANSTVTLAPNSGASLSLNEEGLSLGVSSGTATLASASGAVAEVASNEEARLGPAAAAPEVIARELTADSPAEGSRFLALGDSAGGAVSFSGTAPGGTAAVSLEVSRGGEFGASALRVPAERFADGTLSATAKLAGGDWTWRFVAADGGLSPSRRLSLAVSGPPDLRWPRDGDEVTYRSSVPPIRFDWASVPEAASYTLQLSRDGSTIEREAVSRGTTATVTDLAAGDWRWRVVPVYSIPALSDPVPSPFRVLTVRESPAMEAPVPVSPADGARYEVGPRAASTGGAQGSAGSRTVVFSWRAEAEAASYTVSLYREKGDRTPASAYETARPSLVLERDSDPLLAARGTKYWTVSWNDADGTASPQSVPRSLEGFEQDWSLSASFPPEGYSASESLVPSTRFVWKKSFDAAVSFELSPKADFSQLAYRGETAASSLLGIDCAPGEWYWRVVARSGDGSVLSATEVRRFVVLASLEAPVLGKPLPGSEVSVVAGQKTRFSWEAVPRAEYYTLKLYPVSGAGRVAYASGYLETPECEVALDALPGGEYRAELQAFEKSGALTTGIVGAVGSAKFTLLTPLRPLTGLRPAAGTAYDGLRALREGVTLSWTAPSVPDRLTLRVTRNGKAWGEPIRVNPAQTSIKLARPPEGSYSWRLEAFSGDSDLSPAAGGSFTVRRIPNLPAPLPTSPEAGAVIDYAFLSKNRNIRFEWEPVAGATDYTLSIYRAGSTTPVLSLEGIRGTSRAVTELQVLDRGSFSWTVAAMNHGPEGTLDQVGLAATGAFTIELPQLVSPELKIKGVQYGQ